MKRILFVLGSMGKGGAERVVSLLANELTERNFQVGIACLLKNEVSYPLLPSVKVFDLSRTEKSRAQNSFFWLRSLRMLCREWKPSLLVSFAARINIIAWAATLGLGIPLVVSERNDPSADGRSRALDVLTKAVYRHVDGVIFQTRRAQGHFRSLKNGVVLPNPILPPVRSHEEGEQKVVVSVGSMKPQKNQRLLIAAFAQVHSIRPEASLVIYGEGGLREELEEQVRRLGLTDVVQMPGKSDQVTSAIADATLFVLSSDYEGLSNALLEAMSIGLPCVSTDCAGADEYIADHDSGLLVPRGDEEALANAMLTLLDDEGLRKRMGFAAAKAVQRLHDGSVMADWINYLCGRL